MPLETPFLAAENSAEERRSRSFYRFIVTSPLLMLLTVGLVAHLNKPPHPSPAADADYDRHVLAYRERVVNAEEVTAYHEPLPEADTLREAKAWIAGYASNALLPLPPVAFEDHLRDGVRGEILFAGLALGSQMSVLAGESLESGKAVEATDRALKAAEVVRPLASFELVASIQSVMTQLRPLGVVAQAWPKVPKADRRAFRARLEKLVMHEADVERMNDLALRQVADYADRQDAMTNAGDAVLAAKTMVDRQERAALRAVRAHNASIAKILDAN